MKFLRLYIYNEDKVDIDVEGMTDDEALDMCNSTFVRGTHPGGRKCVVPMSSVVWAEVMEFDAEQLEAAQE